MSTYARVKKWRHQTKQKMVESFDGECGICGYKKCNAGLEFHHLDPSEKEFSFGSDSRSWDRIKEELKKCVMLCGNCHTEVHAEVTEVPNDIQRFDESLVVTVTHRDAQYNNCPICGTEKNIRISTCSKECSVKLIGKVKWHEIDLEAIIKEHNGNIEATGRYLGVTGNAVRKHLKRTIDL